MILVLLFWQIMRKLKLKRFMTSKYVSNFDRNRLDHMQLWNAIKSEQLKKTQEFRFDLILGTRQEDMASFIIKMTLLILMLRILSLINARVYSFCFHMIHIKMIIMRFKCNQIVMFCWYINECHKHFHANGLIVLEL